MMPLGSYRKEPPFVVEQNQDKALTSTMHLLQNLGPMGFLVQEGHEKQTFKVFIGDRHSCSCKYFLKENDLCQHICWILLKKFRISRHDPMSWQSGLCEREVAMLLEKGSGNFRSENEAAKGPHSGDNPDEAVVRQRVIELDDVCPICQDDFFGRQRLPVTFCRKGCGSNVHINCMKIWKDHQLKDKNLDRFDMISCPMCRGEFASVGELNLEITLSSNRFIRSSKATMNGSSLDNIATRNFETLEEHERTCSDCRISPIRGRIYCTSEAEVVEDSRNQDLVLCNSCFEKRLSDCAFAKLHFYWKDKPLEKLHKLPPNFNLLVGFDHKAFENDANWSTSIVEALSRPLSLKALTQIAKWTVKTRKRASFLGKPIDIGGRAPGCFRLGRIPNLLAPGQQCRVCLMHFLAGDEVRKLLGCGHVFHTKCIDPWLLHRSPRCPLDGIFAGPFAALSSNRAVKDKSSKSSRIGHFSEGISEDAALDLKISSIANALARDPSLARNAIEGPSSSRGLLGADASRRMAASPLEVRSVALYHRTSCTPSSRISIQRACKASKAPSNPLRRISEKYWPKL